ncbi:MAG: ACP S-malonyltransferase [Acidimicrobiales bacterium]
MPAAASSSPRTLALAFPGQGGDWGAALGVLAAHDGHPLVQALAAHLGTATWSDLDPLDTHHAQPVVYVAGLVAAAPVPPDEVAVVAGHSLGEITAAAWAGAIEPEAGLALVAARAEVGRRAHGDRPSAMAAVMRVDADAVEWLRRRVLGAGRPGVLEVAVVNSAEQQVLTGDRHLVEAAVALANDEGAVARALPIDGAYHSPLLAPLVGEFRTHVARAVTSDPRVPVVASTVAGPHRTGEALVEVISRSLVLPVDWPAAVDAMVAAGAERAIDAGPGDTLVRLARFLPALPTSAVG